MDRYGLAPSRRLDDADLARTRQLRDRLRSVFEADDEAAAAASVNALLAESEVRPVLEEVDGAWVVRHRSGAASDPVGALQGAAAVALAQLFAERGFDDFKVCAAAPCRDVFVDVSRNGSRRFCGLACANRHRVAAHRRRHRSG